MKKIGILTFHCAHNYGAVLQAYCLQEAIKDLGYEVEIIDYRPDFLVRPYLPIYFLNKLDNRVRIVTPIIWILQIWNNLKRVVSFTRRYPRIKKRYLEFNAFINEFLNLSMKKPTGNSFGNDYETYIIGSDQVWNFKMTKGLDKFYWGDFKTKDSAKKISYAASMAIQNIDSEAEQIKKMLTNFSAISVREDSLKALIQNHAKQKIDTVLDPSLLVNEKVFDSLTRNCGKGDEKYILVYTLGRRNDAIELANRLAEKYSYSIKELTDRVYNKKRPFTDDVASPKDFIKLFQKASFIITSSFHGTTFSILFKKPFFTLLKNQESDTRQISLLSKLGLEDRLLTGIENCDISEINYGKVMEKLEILRQNSLNFLARNL